jgi:hypothetical protein
MNGTKRERRGWIKLGGRMKGKSGKKEYCKKLECEKEDKKGCQKGTM